MSNTPDRCNQLRKLHEQLTSQLRQLRESMQLAEQDGVANPVETLNTLKVLQASLRRVTQQLEQCPPEQVVSSATTAQVAASSPTSLHQQAKDIKNSHWFPESQQNESIFDDDDVLGGV